MDKKHLEEIIIKAAVELHKEYIGVGPAEIRVEYAKNVIVLDLKNCFAVFEKTLVSQGRETEVILMREKLLHRWLEQDSGYAPLGHKIIDAFVCVYPHEERALYFFITEKEIF